MIRLMRAGSHQESARWRMTTTSHLRQAKAGTPMSGLGDCALASGDSTLTSGLGVFAVGIDDAPVASNNGALWLVTAARQRRATAR